MADEIVRVENVSVYFDGNTALEDVSLTIRRDEFLGIIGPNGSGKTTLLKVIIGLIQPSRGRVLVMGRPPHKSRQVIGYVPQFNLFDRDFPINVRDVVLMGRFARQGFLSRYTAADLKRADEVLQTVGMAGFKQRQIGKLSGGEQQRVFIARALMTDPELLILDEPTASVDPNTQADFYALLRRLKERMAIVLVSHDVAAVSTYVDNIACMNRRLVYHGSKEIDPDVLRATYQCPVQLIVHGDFPHRVLKEHPDA